jgi:hypothetical protein
MERKPEITALFAEHDEPTHCSRQTLSDGLAPVDQLVASVRKQVLEYQLKVSAWEAAIAADDPSDGQLEHMHQTFGALEREAAALATATRNLGKAMRQLDRYMADAKADVERREAEVAPAEPPP